MLLLQHWQPHFFQTGLLKVASELDREAVPELVESIMITIEVNDDNTASSASSSASSAEGWFFNAKFFSPLCVVIYLSHWRHPARWVGSLFFIMIKMDTTFTILLFQERWFISYSFHKNIFIVKNKFFGDFYRSPQTLGSRHTPHYLIDSSLVMLSASKISYSCLILNALVCVVFYRPTFLNFLSVIGTIEIRLTDVIDAAPVFNPDSYQFNVPENSMKGTFINQVPYLIDDMIPSSFVEFYFLWFYRWLRPTKIKMIRLHSLWMIQEFEWTMKVCKAVTWWQVAFLDIWLKRCHATVFWHNCLLPKHTYV